MHFPDQRTLRIRAEDMPCPSTGVLMFAEGANEERSRLPAWNRAIADSSDRCLIVVRQNSEEIVLRTAAQGDLTISLRDATGLQNVLPQASLYLDISGMEHQVWAPIIKAAWSKVRELNVVYVEPLQYRPHSSPASRTVFDLSVGFGGMGPLPGFARLAGPRDPAKTLLVPMLGFEGSRPLHLALNLDSVGKVVPLVGVPGFRFDYPAAAIASNRDLLDEYGCHSEIRYARASCPFESLDVLRQLRREYPDFYIYLAPVGTKPHALGAVMFAMEQADSSEIMYDHPFRKPGRTRGMGVAHTYKLKA